MNRRLESLRDRSCPRDVHCSRRTQRTFQMAEHFVLDQHLFGDGFMLHRFPLFLPCSCGVAGTAPDLYSTLLCPERLLRKMRTGAAGLARAAGRERGSDGSVAGGFVRQTLGNDLAMTLPIQGARRVMETTDPRHGQPIPAVWLETDQSVRRSNRAQRRPAGGQLRAGVGPHAGRDQGAGHADRHPRGERISGLGLAAGRQVCHRRDRRTAARIAPFRPGLATRGYAGQTGQPGQPGGAANWPGIWPSKSNWSAIETRPAPGVGSRRRGEL